MRNSLTLERLRLDPFLQDHETAPLLCSLRILIHVDIVNIGVICRTRTLFSTIDFYTIRARLTVIV